MNDINTWRAIESRLASELATLTDGEFVVLGEPAAPAERRGLFGRKAPPPVPYVQFVGLEGWVHGECVGSTLVGGDWELSQTDHDRIRALGWLTPEETDASGTGPPNFPAYWCNVPQHEVATLATMSVGALEVLGADPSRLEWQRDS